MTQPIRIQRKRTKGYDMQAVSHAINGLACVYVGRPSIWGNPYLIADRKNQDEISFSILKFRMELESNLAKYAELRLLIRKKLCGKNLACFCRLDRPCHADVLLELANR